LEAEWDALDADLGIDGEVFDVPDPEMLGIPSLSSSRKRSRASPFTILQQRFSDVRDDKAIRSNSKHSAEEAPAPTGFSWPLSHANYIQAYHMNFVVPPPPANPPPGREPPHGATCRYVDGDVFA
jgi:hypothetical protein